MRLYAKKLVKAVTTPGQRRAIRRFATSLSSRMFELGRKPAYPCEAGVNLLGYIQGDFGLGESCRLLAGSLQASGIPFSIYPVPINSDAPGTSAAWRAYESASLPYGVNIVHLNPDSLNDVFWKLNAKSFRHRYNIGFFLWEQPEFPKDWLYALHLMDEIWTPAEFISQAVRRCTCKPVLTMPYGLVVPETSKEYNRAYFGLPEDTCLFMLSYDGYSNSDRKNPLGSIRAYCQAFSPDDPDVGLIIKATHARPNDLAEFRRLLVGYSNIFILTKNYSKAAFNSLIRCADVYVSLHRAEGFGLVLAEAMQLGTAVIATNWSANTEFMNEQVSCLVPAQVEVLTQDSPPYRKGTHWAHPDEACAARWMRQLYEDKDFRETLCGNARQFLGSSLSQERAAQRIKARLDELCAKGNL